MIRLMIYQRRKQNMYLYINYKRKIVKKIKTYIYINGKSNFKRIL